MGLHWQFGVVQNAVASVSAPSAMVIKDDDGTNNSITLSMGGMSMDVATGGTARLSSGLTLTVGAYSGFSGTAPTSYSWTFTEVTDSNNIITLNTGTTNGQNYTDATIAISGSSEQTALLRITVTGTNSGGSTTSSNFDFNITIS